MRTRVTGYGKRVPAKAKLDPLVLCEAEGLIWARWRTTRAPATPCPFTRI
ncbi:hypothetical protein ACWCZ5_29620 [Streptomyces sp. NPDC001667]